MGKERKSHFRAAWQLFRETPSGQKFQALYHARHERAGGRWGVREFFICMAGCILMVTGLAIGWLSGPGGFIGIIGLVMVSQYSLIISRILDGIERTGHRLWNRFRGKSQAEPEKSAGLDKNPPKKSENSTDSLDT